ncbi:Riboflavin transport system permease protein RibX [Meiothermus luteus]|jgi:NitT/TauT family transport system permease protein|uniref:Riboflavin transport system permease protein RibX n=1 Tax=Meiothermus luteus TaxID=2026184 RepID=A0A399ET76_9DEIN|nr:ABC transporter permease [Meiothermus luteus]RIH86925.1 Riboflavin transport system permease protein RibX [Meiothermus luteus]RMH55372.1 MAG: ABC transporter permease subunit [Deinococcota bacterium]
MRISPNLLPMLVVALVVLALYWPIMYLVNIPVAQRALDTGAALPCQTAFECASQLRSPVLPSPQQLWGGFVSLMFPLDSPNAIPLNAAVTALETLVGLLLATLVGLFFAVGIVASRAFERALLPWIVASQTVPIIAIAPMLVVVLGQYGVQGWIPKAIIAAYIAFFPITIGIAKGLQSPDPLALDLMKTYNAGSWQTYLKLRFPASVPYLFTAFKVAMTAALIGAIVAEISTISFQGIGKMLAENSRASDVVAMWVIMLASAALGIFLVAMVGWLERLLTPWRRAQVAPRPKARVAGREVGA